MAHCSHCKASIHGNVNFWHQTVVPNNPNQKLDISKPLLPFCSASCLTDYVKTYSGETITKAKISGTHSETGIVTILNEPYVHFDKTKQDLNKEGFEKIKNDKNKGDLRSQVGLSPQEKSQQIIYKRLSNLKEKQNMETQAKTITQCDNCKKSLDKDDKGKSIKATLDDAHTKKAANYHYCDEECLRQHLNNRAKRKKSKASYDDVMELNITKDSMEMEISYINKK